MLHRHPFLSIVTLAYLAFVGWVTLTPGSEAPTQSDLVLRVLARLQGYDHLSWLTYDRAEYLANIALFLLFGSRLWWLAVAAAIAMTSCIETVQKSIPGRVSDEHDIAANTMGAVIGVAVGLVLTLPATLRRWADEEDRRRTPESARRR